MDGGYPVKAVQVCAADWGVVGVGSVVVGGYGNRALLSKV